MLSWCGRIFVVSSEFWNSVVPFGGMFSELVRSSESEGRSSHTRAVKDVTLQDEVVNTACVASVRWNGHRTEEDKARWFRIKRGVDLVKCRFSKDCEGCRTSASGDEVSRPHGEECRERVRVAMMCDDAGQQRLRAAEERLAPAASATRAETAQEEQAPPAGVSQPWRVGTKR